MNTRSLRYVMIKHVVDVLEECDNNKRIASEILDTSRRNILNLVNEGREKYGMEVKKFKSNTVSIEEKSCYQIFPTNKERLQYADSSNSNGRYH